MSCQQQQTFSSAGGKAASLWIAEVCFWTPSIPQLLIQYGGKIALFSAEVNDEFGTVYILYFPLFALRKGALVEFVLTLQMFNEQAATAAGFTALMKWWHKTQQWLGMCSTHSTVQVVVVRANTMQFIFSFAFQFCMKFQTLRSFIQHAHYYINVCLLRMLKHS